MSATALRPTARERRLARHLAARREAGLVDALLELKGTRFGSRYECVSLYAVGGEGAVFLVRDLFRRAPLRVAKIALLPFHRPFELDSAIIAKQRNIIAVEARYLAGTGGTFLPKHLGTYDFHNPLLDPARGGVFAEPGTAIVMERLPGHDLDRWLARAHRSAIPVELLRPTLDGVSAMLLQAVAELLERGLLYADLRPANLRMLAQPRRHARLLDAGSLVTVYDDSGRFPHVPAYLPAHMLDARGNGEPILPSPAVQAVMAGRTLYEVATGRIPHPGEEIDEDVLGVSAVSPHIAELIAGLASGQFDDTREALEYLVATAPSAQLADETSDPSAAAHPALVTAEPGPPRAPRPPSTPLDPTGIGYSPSVAAALRRRRRAARHAPFHDGLRALRALTEMTGPATSEAPSAPPPPALPARPAPPDRGALIEVPEPRLLLPGGSVDEEALRAGLTSPAVADAIGRLARGEFRNAADALRYARAAPLHWEWRPVTSAAQPPPPTSSTRPAAAPARAAAPATTPAAPATAPATVRERLPVVVPRGRSLARRVLAGLRRLLRLR